MRPILFRKERERLMEIKEEQRAWETRQEWHVEHMDIIITEILEELKEKEKPTKHKEVFCPNGHGWALFSKDGLCPFPNCEFRKFQIETLKGGVKDGKNKNKRNH